MWEWGSGKVCVWNPFKGGKICFGGGSGGNENEG